MAEMDIRMRGDARKPVSLSRVGPHHRITELSLWSIARPSKAIEAPK
jgi:hypothetical protein